MERIPLADGYREHSPPPDLAEDVACIWTRRGAGGSHRVPPDGSADIIFGFDDELTSSIVVGPMTRAIVVSGPAPRLMLGIRFKPGAAYRALGIPAHTLLDESADYGDVRGWPVPDPLKGALADEERVALVCSVARSCLRTAEEVPRAVREAVRRITQSDGRTRVSSLATDIGVSRQQLARQFAIHVGISPKLLARVMRTQAALARADAARTAFAGIDWSALAQELGYYDQPHLIGEFKELVGVTPTDWAVERSLAD
jgi:AraC-like DNA-binding protein